MARRKRSAGSQSAGYHYDATVKTGPSRTPVKAPKKGQAARGPAGDYAGSAKDYGNAVATLPSAARAVTEAAAIAATGRQARASGASTRAVVRAVEDQRRRQAAILATVRRRQARRQALRQSPNPAKAIISSQPKEVESHGTLAKDEGWKFTKDQLHPGEQQVGEREGKGVAPVYVSPWGPEEIKPGDPPKLKAQKRQYNALLKQGEAVNKTWVDQHQAPEPAPVSGSGRQLKGTRQERRAARAHLRKAKAVVRKSGPDLSGLSPAERRAAELAVKAHRKYPDVPISLAMAQMKQESGFDPGAVSSAGAEGISQFIPSTAASYGVNFGTGQPEVRSQVFGQFALMHDNEVGKNPTLALNDYLGLHGQTTPSEYSSNILAMAQEYDQLDKAKVNPKVLKRLKAAKTEAIRLGLKVGKQPKGIVGPAPKQVVTRFKAIKKLAKGIEKLNIPYIYGGGHNGGMPDPSEGLDCSSSTVYLLRKAGYDVPNITSGEFGNYFPPGPGAVTIFYNPTHVFLRIGNEYWGTSAGDSGSGGLGKHPAPSPEYLKQYSVAHVPGLGKKQALQLGFTDLAGGSTSSSAFPGMTLSSDGTTATINEGAAATKKGSPGFSKKPIRLTPLQRYNRTKRELAALGAPLGRKKRGPETHPILEELIEKYGSAEPNPTAAKERHQRALAAATE